VLKVTFTLCIGAELWELLCSFSCFLSIRFLCLETWLAARRPFMLQKILHYHLLSCYLGTFGEPCIAYTSVKYCICRSKADCFYCESYKVAVAVACSCLKFYLLIC